MSFVVRRLLKIVFVFTVITLHFTIFRIVRSFRLLQTPILTYTCIHDYIIRVRRRTMRTKLTLTIDKQVVDKAKLYAKKKNRSVSKLVEEYLKSISSTETAMPSLSSISADITDKITGMFKNEYKGQNYKELLEDALMEKNL